MKFFVLLRGSRRSFLLFAFDEPDRDDNHDHRQNLPPREVILAGDIADNRGDDEYHAGIQRDNCGCEVLEAYINKEIAYRRREY